MHVWKRKSTWWAFVNIAGMLAFLYLASALWVLPGEEGEPGGPGDAFYFLFFLIPILGIYLVFNFMVLVMILSRLQKPRRFGGLILWAIIALLWVGCVGFDWYKSYREIVPQYCDNGLSVAFD